MNYLICFMLFLFSTVTLSQSEWPIYNGVTNSISFGNEALTEYDEAEVLAKVPSAFPWASAGSADFSFVRVGKAVTMCSSEEFDTGTSPNIIQYNSAVPVGFQPSGSIEVPFRGRVGGTAETLELIIFSNGTLQFRSGAAGNFSGAGNEGFDASCVSYLIDVP